MELAVEFVQEGRIKITLEGRLKIFFFFWMPLFTQIVERQLSGQSRYLYETRWDQATDFKQKESVAV